MPLYEVECVNGHRDEILRGHDQPLGDCDRCGGGRRRLVSRFAVGGTATLPPPTSMMPQTWRGTHEGNREYLASLRRTAEQRRGLEQRHPELRGDDRPVLAHEGRYEAAPLRLGDTVPGHGHAHGHGHEHGHGDAHGHGHTHAQPAAPGPSGRGMA